MIDIGQEQSFGPPVTVDSGERSKISVRDVTRVFVDGKKTVNALGPISLEVGQGEFLCVVGPSGCGKSTLLRIIAGLLDPSAGEVAISREKPNSPLVSVAFQDYSIYPWKTVKENVRFPLDVAGVARKDADALAMHWIERLRLTGFHDAYPGTLSGGMRQRVSIARALVVEPEVLLMDEPFAALDAQLRQILQEELLELWQSDQRTVVFITHNLDEAIILGDRVVVMGASPGRLVAEFEVPFARPRRVDLRADPEFALLQGKLWERLRQQVGKGKSS